MFLSWPYLIPSTSFYICLHLHSSVHQHPEEESVRNENLSVYSFYFGAECVLGKLARVFLFL